MSILEADRGTVPPPSTTRVRETVCAVIPTYNVAGHIRKCLDSLRFADEVVVVDMFSTDRTEAICRGYPNVRFFQRKDYILANFNFGVEQATTDWAMKVDSDEVLDEELQHDIQRVLANPAPGINGYYFNSVQYMFGLPMHYGVGRPELVERLSMFRRGTARYEARSEHEGLTATGPFGHLKGKYEHFTNHDTSEIVRKFDYYTSKDAERLEESDLRAPSVRGVIYRCLRQFFWMYVEQKGYKDGLLGFFSSAFRGPVYILIEEAKRWERWRTLQDQKATTHVKPAV
jgi:glycosyltransferase involved in cell wall biosynthesis